MTEVIIGFSWLAMSFFLLLIMKPSTIRKLGPNSWVGIRIPETISSDEAWAKAHDLAWPGIKAGTIFSSFFVVGGMIYASVTKFENDWFYLSIIISAFVLLLGYTSSISKIRKMTNKL